MITVGVTVNASVIEVKQLCCKATPKTIEEEEEALMQNSFVGMLHLRGLMGGNMFSLTVFGIPSNPHTPLVW